jgi:outer membrane protein insertion porin family
LPPYPPTPTSPPASHLPCHPPPGIIFSLNGGSGSAGAAAPASARGGTPSPRGSAGGAAGAAAASDALRPASYLGDRFYLGGCDSVRGFAYRGLGPSAERARRRDVGGAGGGGGGDAPGAPTRDALGGDLFGSLYAGLVARLPGQLGDIGGCAHAFVNGGSASLLSAPPASPAPPGGALELVPEGGGSGAAGGGAAAGLGGSVRRRAAELAATCRWSAGVGLILPTPFGRFEANYVWVLSGQPGDVPKPGMQFGFAASPISPASPV